MAKSSKTTRKMRVLTPEEQEALGLGDVLVISPVNLQPSRRSPTDETSASQHGLKNTPEKPVKGKGTGKVFWSEKED